jgi:hypothetical protein
MKKTPDEVSKTRQKLRQEIKLWQAGIREACLSLGLEDNASKVALCKAQIVECQKKLAETVSKGRKRFWPHD